MKSDRRTFLKYSLVLPLAGAARAGRAAPRRAAGPPPDSYYYEPWVEISPALLRRNVREISKRAGGRPILAVVKNNGYGLGTLNVAKILEPLPEIFGFAAIKMQEAVVLRDGGISKPVLLMALADRETLDEAMAKDITLILFTGPAAEIDRAAARFQRPVKFHACVDTGIGRIGVPFRDAERLIRAYAGRPSLKQEGIMMTFSEDPELDPVQEDRFRTLCDGLSRAGVSLGKRHAVSSFGLFQRPGAFLDMVRPGMVLYGIYPEKEFRGTNLMDLRPAIALKTRVVYVKKLRKGDSAGYNRAYLAKNDVWVATLPIGHADGLPRLSTKGGKIKIGGAIHPVVAVSASHAVLEIGPEETVRAGDIAVVFDDQPGSRPEDFVESFGGSVYDLVMHLSALMPRRVTGS